MAGDLFNPHAAMRRIFTPIVVAIAIVYFIIDAVFVALLRPLGRRLAELEVFAWLGRWVDSLGPYPTLVLFLVPIAIFEPVKPVGLYLIGTHRAVAGILFIAIGELLKIVTVERLFHKSKDKLMAIRAFAVVYLFVTRWLDWLKALPAWQTVLRRVEQVKAFVRRLMVLARD